MICTGQSPALLVAAASGAESTAEGLGLGGRFLVLDLDLRGSALVVNGVVLAGANITADTGYLAMAHFLFTHCFIPPIVLP